MEVTANKKSMVSERSRRYDSYKDSGVEWLGDIPEHWEVFPLFALTQLKSITNCVGEELLSVYLDKGVIRFSDVTAKRTNVTSLDLSKYQLVEQGDFVLNNQQAWRGSVGVSSYRGIVSPAYIVLKLRESLNPSFANYLFRDGSMVSQYLINSKGVGTIQRNLYWPSLRRSSISLPPLPEQTAIAQFLDDKTTKIDEAIAIKQQQIALLKERKQILIHKAVTRGVTSSAVEMKDSGVEWIGEIPEHWEVSRLKNHMNMITGFPFKSDKYVDKGIKLARGINVKEGVLDWKDTRYWPKIEDHLIDYLLKDGDVLIAMDGSKVGKNFCQIKDSDLPILLLQRVARLRPKESLLSDFLYFNIVNRSFLQWVEMTKTDPMVPHISPADIKNFLITIPPLSEQKEIANYIETASTKIETAMSLKEQEISKLQEYKSSLINSVVTGKVRVC